MGIRITIEDTADGQAVSVAGAAAAAVGSAPPATPDLDGGAPGADLISALSSTAGEELLDGPDEPEAEVRAGPVTQDAADGGAAAVDAGGPDMTVGELIENLGGLDDPDSDPID